MMMMMMMMMVMMMMMMMMMMTGYGLGCPTYESTHTSDLEPDDSLLD